MFGEFATRLTNGRLLHITPKSQESIPGLTLFLISNIDHTKYTYSKYADDIKLGMTQEKAELSPEGP